MLPETPKVWGTEVEVVNHPLYCGKLLLINPGWRCSLHYHPCKAETFLCVEGEVGVQLANEHLTLAEGMKVDIPAGTPHRFGSLGGATLVEFSTHHSDADVVRLEPSGPIEECLTPTISSNS